MLLLVNCVLLFTLASSPKNRNLYPTSITSSTPGYFSFKSRTCSSKGDHFLFPGPISDLGLRLVVDLLLKDSRNCKAIEDSCSSSSSSTSMYSPSSSNRRRFCSRFSSNSPNFLTNSACRRFFSSSRSSRTVASVFGSYAQSFSKFGRDRAPAELGLSSERSKLPMSITAVCPLGRMKAADLWHCHRMASRGLSS